MRALTLRQRQLHMRGFGYRPELHGGDYEFVRNPEALKPDTGMKAERNVRPQEQGHAQDDMLYTQYSEPGITDFTTTETSGLSDQVVETSINAIDARNPDPVFDGFDDKPQDIATNLIEVGNEIGVNAGYMATKLDVRRIQVDAALAATRRMPSRLSAQQETRGGNTVGNLHAALQARKGNDYRLLQLQMDEERVGIAALQGNPAARYDLLIKSLGRRYNTNPEGLLIQAKQQEASEQAKLTPEKSTQPLLPEMA